MRPVVEGCWRWIPSLVESTSAWVSGRSRLTLRIASGQIVYKTYPLGSKNDFKCTKTPVQLPCNVKARSPAPGAHIFLYDGDRYIRLIKLDEKGRFNFTVYGDFDYAILARLGASIGESLKRLSITEKSTGLKLVLKRVD